MSRPSTTRRFRRGGVHRRHPSTLPTLPSSDARHSAKHRCPQASYPPVGATAMPPIKDVACPRVEGPQARFRHPADLDPVCHAEGLHGRRGGVRVDPGQLDPPQRGLEPIGQARGAGLHHVDHVQAGRERGVQGGPQRVRLDPRRQSQLEVLGLTGRAGGGGIGVGDLGMRIEPRRVGHRRLDPPQGTLQRALEVTVAGEPQPAPLGVPDAHALHRGRRWRSFGLAGHDQNPKRAAAVPRRRSCPGSGAWPGRTAHRR